MALFSTLLSASSEQSASTSSSIPTLIQLFSSKSLTFDENAKLDSHAVLSYQALEVAPPQEDKLFSQRRGGNNSASITTPNLGVWNCCISKQHNALVDSLLTIPDAASSNSYCLTVDLTDPTMVEPSLSILHEALVRLLIQQAPSTSSAGEASKERATTSLAQLKVTQFGLAPEDKPSSSIPTSTAEDDTNVKLAVMICALLGPSTKDDYKETQAQNLVLYHLRRYAAALDATLVFVGSGNMESSSNINTEDVSTIPLDEISYSWREWILGNAVENITFSPGNHQPDLIESVLLRNAQYTGEWDASKDSLWKALPSSEQKEEEVGKKHTDTGDDAWLSQLRDSMAAVSGDTSARAAAPAAPVAAAAEGKDVAVSSFFENLLKK
jgi:hypothetical protein